MCKVYYFKGSFVFFKEAFLLPVLFPYLRPVWGIELQHYETPSLTYPTRIKLQKLEKLPCFGKKKKTGNRIHIDRDSIEFKGQIINKLLSNKKNERWRCNSLTNLSRRKLGQKREIKKGRERK